MQQLILDRAKKLFEAVHDANRTRLIELNLFIPK